MAAGTVNGMRFGLARWARGAVFALAMCAAAMMGGCTQDSAKDDGLIPVRIKGQAFRLEAALDDQTRMRGLGGRASLPEKGGMLFVFPLAEERHFVMRDCVIDIDIAYLDDTGRVMTIHAMKAEEPRRVDEPVVAYPGQDLYEERLTKYHSRFPCRFVVEVAGGTFARLGLQTNDTIEFDAAGLKRRAR